MRIGLTVKLKTVSSWIASGLAILTIFSLKCEIDPFFSETAEVQIY